MRKPLEEPPARVLEHDVVIRSGAEVDRIAEIAHASVPPCVVPADFGGAVGRGVVADHQFQIVAGLRERRTNGLFEIPLPVVDRNADGHRRVAGSEVAELIHSVLARNLASMGQNVASLITLTYGVAFRALAARVTRSSDCK